MTLEQILKFVEAKEAGKRSASRLLLPQATDVVAGSSYRKQKKCQSRNHCQNTRIPAHIVGPRDTGETPQRGSGEPNAQPMAPSVTTVTKITTSKGCVESRTAQRRPNAEMRYSTHCVGCPQRTTLTLRPWTTTSLISSPRGGYGDSPSHNHLLGYR